MKRLLCLLGLHKYKCTTKSTSINGTIKTYFKCMFCFKKKMVRSHVPECWKCISKIKNGICDCNSC